MESLGQIGAAAVKATVPALRDKNEVVRHRAANALERMNDEAAIKEAASPENLPVVIAALSDSCKYVRSDVIRVLARIDPTSQGAREAAAALEKSLSEPDDFDRANAAEGLVRLGKPQVGLTALVRWLDDPDGDRGAAQSLRCLGTMAAPVKAQIEAAGKRARADGWARGDLAVAMVQLGDKEQGLAVLGELLKAKDEDHIRGACWAVGLLGSEAKPLESVIEAFEKRARNAKPGDFEFGLWSEAQNAFGAIRGVEYSSGGRERCRY